MDARAHFLLRAGAILVLAVEAALPRASAEKPAEPAPALVAPAAPTPASPASPAPLAVR